MTILSQAETIRDETTAGANTATRVGTCLVDIANQLVLDGMAISDAQADATQAIADAAAAQAKADGIVTQLITGDNLTQAPSDAAVYTALAAKQNALGFTAENVANKATNFSTLNDTLYPTVRATENRIVESVSSVSSYFFYNTASNIATYLQMQINPSTGGSQTITALGVTGTQTIASFATNANYPNKVFMPVGWTKTHFHASKTGGGTATLFAEIYKRTTGGVETLLLTTPPTTTALATTITEYTVDCYNPAIVPLDPTDRIVIKIRATVTSGAPDINLFVEDAYLSRLDLPVSQPTTLLVPYTGATDDVNLGAHTITAQNFSGSSSGTNTGDQTNISGNAGTATALATGRTIDGQTFDGTDNITVIAPATNAATSKVTPVDADELPIVDSAASNVLKKLTWANLKATIAAYYNDLSATMTNKTIQYLILAAGGTGAGQGALKFTSGSMLTSPEAGVVGYDGKVMYQSPTAGNRGVLPTILFQTLVNDNVLGNASSALPIFNGTANGAITLESGTTYEFEICLRATHGSSTTTKTMQLVVGGGAMTISYTAVSGNAAANSYSATLEIAQGSSSSPSIQLISSRAGTGFGSTIKGIIRCTTGGTLTPKYQHGDTQSVTILANSFIKLVPMGGNAVVSSGNWS